VCLVCAWCVVGGGSEMLILVAGVFGGDVYVKVEVVNVEEIK
jgi:hypothetical protein